MEHNVDNRPRMGSEHTVASSYNDVPKEDGTYYGGNNPYVNKLPSNSPGSSEDPAPPNSERLDAMDKPVQEEPSASEHYSAPSLFAPQLKQERKFLIKSIARVEFLMLVIVLGILSIYWGGLASMLPNEDVLTVAVVDFDGQEVGNALSQFALNQRRQAEQADQPVLGYITQSGSLYSNDPEVLKAHLLNENMWVAIAIEPYATELMNYAYQNGNRSYDPTGAIQVYYQEARNALVQDEFIQPLLDDFLHSFVNSFAKQKVSEIASASSTNLTALQNVLTVPIPVSFTKINLAPFLPVVGEAATQIGLIYLIIVSFFSVLFFSPVHPQIAGKIRTIQYYAYRLTLPVVSYFFLSLLYTVLSVIWGINFNTYYGHAGFVIYWMLSWLSMIALGLPVENINNAVGMPWTAIFLIFWVISNVTVGFFPNEILSNFYKWGLAWPFYHIVKGSSTLIFGTKDLLALNFGILFAWAGLSYALLPITVWLELRRNKAMVAKNRDQIRGRMAKNEEKV